jgi:hypothetical protein
MSMVVVRFVVVRILIRCRGWIVDLGQLLEGDCRIYFETGVII